MPEFKLPEFKLGINGSGIRSNQRDMSKFYGSYKEPNKPVIAPKRPEPNVFFTPVEDNRELILKMMKKDLDDKLEFTRTYLPSYR